MVIAKEESTRTLVIRAVLVMIALFAVLTLTMPHRSLVRRSTTAILPIAGALAYILYRRRQKAAE